MKRIIVVFIIFFAFKSSKAQEQKTISDCTVIYTVVSSDKENADNIASKTVYIKGKDLRVDLVSKLFSQTVFYNEVTGNAAVLKNVGESKYISQYNAEEWNNANSRYNGLSVLLTDSTKNILGYNCKQAVLSFKNGSKYVIYYIPGYMPSVMEAPFEAKNVPGLVLEYKATIKNNEEILYSAQKIDFKPVVSSQFEIPKTGYRILH